MIAAVGLSRGGVGNILEKMRVGRVFLGSGVFERVEMPTCVGLSMVKPKQDRRS